jgi:hypothetical protein
MLLVFTSNANNSDEIKKDVDLAGRHHVTVVPVRVEDVAPNDALAYEFATRQWIDLFTDCRLHGANCGSGERRKLPRPARHRRSSPTRLY